MKSLIRIVLLAALALVPTTLASRPDLVTVLECSPPPCYDPCPTC